MGRRSGRKRKPGRIAVAICEGWTEHNYCLWLRRSLGLTRHNFIIEKPTGKTDPEKLAARAAKFRGEHRLMKTDLAFALVDGDQDIDYRR